MKTLALTTHTRISANLALNVRVQREGVVNLVTFPVIDLTALAFLLWSAWLTLGQHCFTLCGWAGVALDFCATVVVALAPFWSVGCIVVKSLAWGLGLKL